MAHVVAFANQKGGVAKTTTVVTVAAALAERGRRVLVVDLDAQGCATFCLGFDPEDLQATVADTILGSNRRPAGEILLECEDGVDLLPASLDLARADQALASTMGREYVLREAIGPLRDRYDWILLDCSPSLGMVTINALVAADEVIVPLQCETLSHRGVGQLLETIEEVRRFANPALRILGILPTLFDGRTMHARSILADLPDRYGLPVLPPIHRSIRFAEAPATGRTILATAGMSRGARDYRSLAAYLETSAPDPTDPDPTTS
jgi:chromosome partitioning protein